MNDQFPEIAAALEREPAEDFIADGELVAFRDGITSFERLQQRHRKHVPVFSLPLRPPPARGRGPAPAAAARAQVAPAKGLRFDDPIRFNPHRNRDTARSCSARPAGRASRA